MQKIVFWNISAPVGPIGMKLNMMTTGEEGSLSFGFHRGECGGLEDNVFA